MYTISGCILFDLIVDTDVGLLKLIQKDYNNPKIFIPGILNERDVNILKMIMTDRGYYNPLKGIMIEGTKAYENADSLYDQFMEKHQEDILKLSTQTSLFDIIRRSSSMGDAVKFDILCRNELERNTIMSRFRKFKITPSVKIVDDLSEFDPSQYGSIYVKDIRDALLFSKFEGKNVIIGNYKFNCENNLPLVPLKEVAAKLLLRSNVIKMIDIYYIDQSNFIG